MGMLGFLFGSAGTVATVEDEYELDTSVTVTVLCEHKKKKVTGILGGDIQLKASSEWEGFISGGGSGGLGSGVIGGLDKLSQIGNGQTIQQPWLGRKTWKGTTPLSFALKLRFAAISTTEVTIEQTGGKAEVYDPCMALLSFAYPRQLTGKSYEGEHKEALGKSDDNKDIASMFKLYAIPGPSLLYDPKNKSSAKDSDPVEITVGTFLELKGCYLKEVSITFSKVFDSYGWPLTAEADLTVESMDVAYVNSDTLLYVLVCL